MSTGEIPRTGEVLPDEAWDILSRSERAQLVDVRTMAEWTFVGIPDLAGLPRSPIFVEWQSYPDMSVNARFVEEVAERSGENTDQFLFLCRSGARSLRAAEAVAAHLSANGRAVECLNVAEGFEGDLGPQGHRGSQNGWKVRGLAWRQS